MNLRKYIELTKSDFSEQPVYEVLSNLIHGRICAKDKEGNELKEDVFNNGCTEIQNFLKNMTYQDILDAMSDDELENLINAEGDYVKVIAFRLKFERDEVLFAKLRKKYPASYKFMNETNHIENDYVFQLDPLKFYSIPEFCLNELKKCIQEN